MTAKKKKSEDKAAPSAIGGKRNVAPTPTAPAIARRPEPRKPDKTIDWTCLHLSARSGYKWTRISYKYNPDEHAQLCRQMRDGELGCGYYVQFESPLAAPGSLLEVLHPHEIHRVDFDTLDRFLGKTKSPAVSESGESDRRKSSRPADPAL